MSELNSVIRKNSEAKANAAFLSKLKRSGAAPKTIIPSLTPSPPGNEIGNAAATEKVKNDVKKSK